MPTPPPPSRLHPLAPLVTATTLAALLLLGGCATTDEVGTDAPFTLSEDYTDGVVSYTVQRGDRLGDIALEFTGDMSLWTEIARSNGIDDPRELRAGAVLRIPTTLIPGYDEKIASRGSRAAPAAEGSTPGESERVPTSDAAPVVASGLAVRAATAEPVELSSVDVNRRFDLAPLDGTASAAVSAPAADPAPETVPSAGEADAEARRVRRVMVVGSYTPKGIYAQPAAYSKLLKRVAPGTLFELEDEVRGWYGVVLPDGIGYLRSADGRLIEEEGERTASVGRTRG